MPSGVKLGLALFAGRALRSPQQLVSKPILVWRQRIARFWFAEIIAKKVVDGVI
jgi:hypothetical protein